MAEEGRWKFFRGNSSSRLMYILRETATLKSCTRLWKLSAFFPHRSPPVVFAFLQELFTARGVKDYLDWQRATFLLAGDLLASPPRITNTSSSSSSIVIEWKSCSLWENENFGSQLPDNHTPSSGGCVVPGGILICSDGTKINLQTTAAYRQS